MTQKSLNERAEKLLKLLIQQYIHSGDPVGSKVLAEQSGTPLSSATIRSVMADLEDAGYLHSPHTSSGRVPTEKGYRFFVDSLLTAEKKPEEKMNLKLKSGEDTASLLKSTGNLLSDVTKLAGLVSLPKRSRVYLEHIEFLPLSEKRILVVLVFNDREVQNRIITTDRTFTAQELQQASNFLNEQYVGKSLLAIRRMLLQAMKKDRQQMNCLMNVAIEMAARAFQQDLDEDSYLVAGQSHLLGMSDITGLDQVKMLFDTFARKRAILHLIDKCLSTGDTHIFIGKEAGNDVFKNMSIIAAPYHIDGEILGVLGVIGPTRMPYDRMISVVNMTARLLNSALARG